MNDDRPIPAIGNTQSSSLDCERIKNYLDRAVRETEEEMLYAQLDAEADKPCNAHGHEQTKDHRGIAI